MRNIVKKSLFIVISCLLASTLYAETETHPSEATSNEPISGTSYTIDGTYIAGPGSV